MKKQLPTSMSSNSFRSKIAAPPLVIAVLAAGEGRRLQTLQLPGHKAGQVIKPLLPLGETTFIQRSLETALSLNPELVVPVLGFAADKILPVLPRDSRIVPVLNRHYRNGQGGSLRLAAETAVHRVPGCCLCVLLVDMPLITDHHIRQVWNGLIRFLQTEGEPAAARAFYQPSGTPGHPVIFSPAATGVLKDLEEEDGSPNRYLRRQLNGRLALVPFYDDAVILDVDTPAAYREAVHRLFPNSGN